MKASFGHDNGQPNAVGWPAFWDRQVMGWRVASLAICVGAISAAAWAGWLTREVMSLREKRIVAVSLKTLVENYVSNSARAGLSDDEAARRTKAYLSAVEQAIGQLNDGHTTVIVSEAVLGRSVPDVTPAVEAAVERAVGVGRTGSDK